MSIGIGDTVADDATMATVNAILEAAKEEVKRIIEAFQNGQLEAQPVRFFVCLCVLCVFLLPAPPQKNQHTKDQTPKHPKKINTNTQHPTPTPTQTRLSKKKKTKNRTNTRGVR